MKFMCCLTVLGALIVGEPNSGTAAGYQVRQYYSGWQKNTTANYYYRTLYYKPSDTYVGYKHHYVCYYPTKPKYYYFYNPYKKLFWGRCPTEYGGQPQYSLLAEQDRRPEINNIPEAAFPQPGALPALPESTDNTKLDLPPDDLPNDQPAATN